MKATTRRGAPGVLPAKKKKKKTKVPARGFMCGCGGASSVSTVPCTTIDLSAVAATPMKAASTAPKPAASEEANKQADGAPSVDSLLRQLRELERGVRALGVRERDRARDDAGGGGGAPRVVSARPPPIMRGAATSESDYRGGTGAVVERRVDLDSGSVAVVTESSDPLRDFRRSMAQMIVENGISGGAELRGLLRRFLALNSPCHHHLILLAFADVWEDLFGGRAIAAAAGKPPQSRTDTSATAAHSRRPRVS